MICRLLAMASTASFASLKPSGGSLLKMVPQFFAHLTSMARMSASRNHRCRCSWSFLHSTRSGTEPRLRGLFYQPAPGSSKHSLAAPVLRRGQAARGWSFSGVCVGTAVASAAFRLIEPGIGLFQPESRADGGSVCASFARCRWSRRSCRRAAFPRPDSRSRPRKAVQELDPVLARLACRMSSYVPTRHEVAGGRLRGPGRGTQPRVARLWRTRWQCR